MWTYHDVVLAAGGISIITATAATTNCGDGRAVDSNGSRERFYVNAEGYQYTCCTSVVRLYKDISLHVAKISR